ncbi:purine phosphoribosyltransferase family protein Apf isoform X2 [Oratosquilla oratoria]
MAAELRAAGLVVFRRMKKNIEYLLMEASYEKNLWTPPKGHVDPGESDMETALRETCEEAGLTEEHLSIIKDFKQEIKYEARGKPKCVIYWPAELEDPNTPIILSEEHNAFKWLPLQDACTLARYPEMIDILKECEKYLLKHS